MASLLAAGLASFWPQRQIDTVAVLDRSTDQRPPPNRNVAGVLPLPAELEVPSLEKALRDPFAAAPRIQPLPPAPAMQAVVAPAAAAPAPAPPPPPALHWRYLGAMTTPDGQQLVMLIRNEGTPVVATSGLRLDDGFEVVAVDATGIRLRHPNHSSELVIPIPPPPSADR